MKRVCGSFLMREVKKFILLVVMSSLKHHIFYGAFKPLAQDIQAVLDALTLSEKLQMADDGSGVKWTAFLTSHSKTSRVRFMAQFLEELKDQGKLREVAHMLVGLSMNKDWRARKNVTYMFVETPALITAGGIISDANMVALSQVCHFIPSTRFNLKEGLPVGPLLAASSMLIAFLILTK